MKKEKLIRMLDDGHCCKTIKGFLELAVDHNIQGLNLACSSWWRKGQLGLPLIVEDILHHLHHLHFVLIVHKKPRPFSICAEEGTL